MGYLLVRVLALGAIFWIALKIYQRWMRQPAAVPRARSQRRFVPMNRCAECGVHYPTSEITQDGKCSKCSK